MTKDDARTSGRPPRRDAPMWRQAAEGIALVVALSMAVATVGVTLALLVSLLY